MSPSAPIPPEKRGVAAVLFTLLGFVAGALGMFGGLAVLHARVLHDTGTSSGAQHAVLQILTEHLPSESNCRPDNIKGPSVSNSAYAMVVCDGFPGGTPLKVEYALFHDEVAINDFFTSEESTYFGGNSPSGDCQKQAHGGGPWYSSGEKTDSMIGSLRHVLEKEKADPMSTPGGRMICYSDGSHYWIEWADDDTHIFGFASATSESYSRLFAWWESRHSGPFHPRHTETAGTTPSM
jgi:hypothetical protein